MLIAALLPLLLARACGQVITRISPTAVATPTVVLTIAATVRPTATPAPYTPAPTPTPTVTPTPIVYRLKGGDTLMGIAAEFDTTLQAIQDANGITDPRGLLVGQEIVIPRPAAKTEAESPTVTPTPMPFAVENVAFNRTPLGGLWCLGEIHNTADVDLEQAGVIVTLLDDQQKPLAQAQAPASQELISPGGRAPFAVRFAQPPINFSSYLVQPAAGVRGFVGSYYRDLVVTDVAGEGERYAAYTVHGRVANTGPEDAVEVDLTVTLYDGLGRVIGVRRAPPDHNVILKGGETSFSLQLTPAGGPVASVRVEALGRRLPTPTPGPRAAAPGIALASSAEAQQAPETASR
jgi:LysM repeat protein